MFLRLFSTNILQHIAHETTAMWNSKKDHPRGPQMNFTKEDVLGLIKILLFLCGSEERLKDHLKDKERKGLGTKRYNKIRKVLTFDIETVVNLFNANLKVQFIPAGNGSGDELMWGWESDHENVRTIPHKPIDKGIIVYAIAFSLTRSKRPLLWHIIPDLRIPVITPFEVLNATLAHWPNTDITLTVDALFSNLRFLTNHSDRHITMAMTKSHISNIWSLFTFELKYCEYRIFRKENVIIAFWLDNRIMSCASTSFSISESESVGQVRGIDLTGNEPLISAQGAQILETLSIDDLRRLAGAQGTSKGLFSG